MKAPDTGGARSLAPTPDPLREMASALVDGETSEFECRRLLGALPGSGISGLLERHYTVRSLLRRDSPVLCPPELTRSLLEAIAAEPLPAAVVPSGAPRWHRWAGGAAVAASVCLVAVMGARTPSSPGDSPAPAQIASVGTSLGALGNPASVMPLAQPAGTPVGFGQVASPAEAGNRAAERRLRAFMVEHAQNAALTGPRGMIPFVRVVSDEEP